MNIITKMRKTVQDMKIIIPHFKNLSKVRFSQGDFTFIQVATSRLVLENKIKQQKLNINQNKIFFPLFKFNKNEQYQNPSLCFAINIKKTSRKCIILLGEKKNIYIYTYYLYIILFIILKIQVKKSALCGI